MLNIDTETPETEAAGRASPPETHTGFGRLVREPLLHFILAGTAVYLLFFLFRQSDSAGEIATANSIVISQGEVDSLTQKWQQLWNRPPTELELQGLIDQQIRETVLYREALAMGLDADDVIIRRRLAQKLEFLSQDLIQPKPPKDGELESWFDKNIDRYQAPDLVTFTHVFLDPDKRGDATLDDAQKLKEGLVDEEPAGGKRQGDPFMLQPYYPERSESDLSKLFGAEFAKSVMDLEPGTWHGPVLSGYGVHLVYVHDRQQFPPPEFNEVAGQVQEDWLAQRRAQMNDEYIESLLRRYNVVIERPSEKDSATEAFQ